MPCRGASNDTHNICFLAEIRENISTFQMKKRKRLIWSFVITRNLINFLSDIIQEDFVGFVNVSDGTDGENLTRKILDLVEKLHLDPNKMRSQCYDGAGRLQICI